MLTFDGPAAWTQAVAPVTNSLALNFPQHPRLLYTAAELKAWKADPGRAVEFSNCVMRADRILAAGLQMPEKEGDWVFYYACPKDNAHLRAESEGRHVCPVCKKVFTDERTRAAYRTILYERVDASMIDLALAYALSGDRRYAEPVRATMLKLAALYPTFTRHDRWGRRGLLAVAGGRRYAQHLDEAVSVIKLASAYDLACTAPCFTAEDRATIENGLIGFIAREIQRYDGFIGGRNNHQTWFNAAYANAGVAIGDVELIDDSVNGQHGLRWQLLNSITSDGMWYEGSFAYQSYAMQALMRHLDALKRAGVSFVGDARLKGLWTGPINLAYPDGSLPVFHDSDPMTLNQFQTAFEWGARYFNDQLLKAYAVEGRRIAIQPASADLTGIGVAVLRHGTGENALCAMIDYGQHGDHHGHPDKLNIVLWGLGRELLLDPGRISYSVPEYKTWCRTTVAHNTVVIDGQDQKPVTGELSYFTNTASYAAAVGFTDKAYPGTRMTRALVLMDGLLIDLFAVDGEGVRKIDWLTHCRGQFITNGLSLRSDKGKAGRDNGYQHLDRAWRMQGAATNCFRYRQDSGKVLAIWMPDTPAVQISGGLGIGYRLNDQVPYIMRHIETDRYLFATVYDLSGTGDAIRNIQVTSDQNGAVTLRVDRHPDVVSLTFDPRSGALPLRAEFLLSKPERFR